MSVIYHNMAMSYKDLLEYGKGLDVLFKSLEIKQKRKDSTNISKTYGIIANYYSSMGLNEKSIEFNEKALKLISCVKNKLRGRDFDPVVPLSIEDQVDML